MQKFRFLLPLFILTLTVAAISFSVQSYRAKSSSNEASVVENADGELTSQQDGEPEQQGFLARLFGSKKTDTTETDSTNSNNSTNPNMTSTPAPSPVVANFTQSEISVPVNQEREVFISLDSKTNSPTAYTFNIRFDPSSISVIKVQPGDIWQSPTIFTKGNSIDNTNGTLSFSAGQSLGTQKASGTTLIKVILKAKATAATGSELTILDSSKFAYVGLDYAVPVKSQSIQVKVTK